MVCNKSIKANTHTHTHTLILESLTEQHINLTEEIKICENKNCELQICFT